MNIQSATQRYETWLTRQIPLVREDLRLKHALMKQDGFSFLRATFYRWTQVWSEKRADLGHAPTVLAVADLHVENFGTWRDKEGRLIWGINDFDEAYPLPYTNDLVRLAVSAKLAIRTDHLTIKAQDAYDAILTGYMEGLQSGGRPYVLSEHHVWLRNIATNTLRDPVRFWRRMADLPPVNGAVQRNVRAALDRLMPEPGLTYNLSRRVSGLGSLGRPRYVARTEWHGGNIAREAKAMSPSACVWARDARVDTILYQSIVDQAIRCPDPLVRIEGSWLVRRLSPYCSRIELASLPKKRDEGRLLHAMGWETANVHLGSHKVVNAIQRDLGKRPTNWLRVAAREMTRATMGDWKDWTNS